MVNVHMGGCEAVLRVPFSRCVQGLEKAIFPAHCMYFFCRYSLLKGQTGVECRFLFARCCYMLNKLQEGELALTGALFPGSTTDLKGLNDTNGAVSTNTLLPRFLLRLGRQSALPSSILPSVCSACCESQAYALLGDICRRSSRPEHAIECYRRSLEQNPFLWSSFEALCSLGEALSRFSRPHPAGHSLTLVCVCSAGAKPVASECFTASGATLDRLVRNFASPAAAPTMRVMDSGATATADAPSTPVSFARATPDAAATPGPAQVAMLKTPHFAGGTPATPGIGSFSLAGSGAAVPVASALGSPMPMWSYTTPSPSTGHYDTPDAPNLNTPKEPQLPTRKSTRLSQAKSATKDPPIRRSKRLFSSTKSTKNKEPSKLKEAAGKAQVKSKQAAGTADADWDAADPPIPTISVHPGPTGVDIPTLTESISASLTLLGQLGSGVAALADFRCKEAIDSFLSLPPTQLNTGWAYCNIGKAFFELAKYKEADKAFRMARRLEPYRTQGMEIYSTTLWHLRQESALSYLAHEVTAADRNSPESWCVVGNCFSLQKEHDAAVKSLERAVQLDPSFAYAHTLLGHEYISNEDFSKALECFRSAVHHDARHYNAWYGLGMIYYRQERFVGSQC